MSFIFFIWITASARKIHLPDIWTAFWTFIVRCVKIQRVQQFKAIENRTAAFMTAALIPFCGFHIYPFICGVFFFAFPVLGKAQRNSVEEYPAPC